MSGARLLRAGGAAEYDAALTDPRVPGPVDGASDRLAYESEFDRVNHNVFRFPAKFHPPVVRSLIERYTDVGGVVLDPFCGSGSTLVEALAGQRSAVGTDVDPLSVFLSRAKTERYDLNRLERAAEVVLSETAALGVHDEHAFGDFQQDIGADDYAAGAADLGAWIPAIPNLAHWFRRRVVLQLATIRRACWQFAGAQERMFLDLCFAAIIRNASNADPVPVSGLEVTQHMRAREALGRTIDPYALFALSVQKTLAATAAFVRARGPGTFARVARADARTLSARGTGRVQAVITSPPYLAAVDYYRRHQLEMYWLGLIGSSAERLELLPRYLGRDRVAARGFDAAAGSPAGEVARSWLDALAPDCAPERRRAFVHYCAGMADALRCAATVVQGGGPVVVVVGNVCFRGEQVSMPDLLEALAAPRLQLVDRLWYPITNRYMSYDRKHGANIDTDHVLVFRAPRPGRA